MRLLLLSIITIILFACKTKTETNTSVISNQQAGPGSIPEQEANEMLSLYQQILKLAKSVPCTGNFEGWKTIGIGSKPCGGPTGYIAYSPKINELELINLIEIYNEKGHYLNKKYNLISDCMLVEEPKDLSCSNGKVVFKAQSVIK